MIDSQALTAPQTEAKARRVARQYGHRVHKSRERTQHFNNRGGLQLVDPYRNEVLAGADFDCTPAEIIYHAEHLGRPPQQP
jgi:hypothetical protein